MNNTYNVCDPDRRADAHPLADPIADAIAQALAEAFNVKELIALRAEIVPLRQERDDWKLAFETSNDAVGKLESRFAALTAALEGLEHLWQVHAGVLRKRWAADENEAVALAFEMCAKRLAALRTPEDEK